MKKLISAVLSLLLLFSACSVFAGDVSGSHTLYYQGHASLRITTAEGKVIYVDPYSGDGYDVPADLILVTHRHDDHNAVHKIKNRNEGCQVITWKEGLVNGEYQTFDLGYATVEAVQAGNNRNHDIKECVGWVIALSGGVTVYAAGDTSTTEQMAELGERDLHYAFFPVDGIFNMEMDEAIACAELVNARHNIPYHTIPSTRFDQARAELFQAPNLLIVPAGEEIVLE